MNKKYFVFGDKKPLSKDQIREIERQGATKLKELDDSITQMDVVKMREEEILLHVYGRVLVKIDTENKNKWTFSDGNTITYSRQFNNLNRRETEPVNCIVISAEGIPKNTEILIHPNGIHDSNRVFNYKNDIGNVRYYSIPKEMCFAWLDGNEWQPIAPFDFALRVFKPYTGVIQGIEPSMIKDVLYVTTGELNGKVVKTLRACDYCIVFQDKNGREGQLLRFRPFGDPEKNMEEESIAIMNDLTDQVDSGELLIGITLKDAKTIEIVS